MFCSVAFTSCRECVLPPVPYLLHRVFPIPQLLSVHTAYPADYSLTGSVRFYFGPHRTSIESVPILPSLSNDITEARGNQTNVMGESRLGSKSCSQLLLVESLPPHHRLFLAGDLGLAEHLFRKLLADLGRQGWAEGLRVPHSVQHPYNACFSYSGLKNHPACGSPMVTIQLKYTHEF